MPDAFELPRVWRAVVPLVRGERFAGLWRGVVGEFVALAFGRTIGSGGRFAGWGSGLVPCFAAVIGALNNLPEPAARLGRIEPIWIDRGSFEMVHLPTGKVRFTDIPAFPLCV